MTRVSEDNDDLENDSIFDEYRRLTPEALLNHPSVKPRIERRGKFLEKIYTESFAGWRGIYLNRALLKQAADSYYRDLYQLKFFRPVFWADQHKRAAYTMKWLARIRPVQLSQSNAMPRNSAYMANAAFAFIAGISFIKYHKTDWLKEYLDNMIYLLHYHAPGVEFLSSEMFLFERAMMNAASSAS